MPVYPKPAAWRPRGSSTWLKSPTWLAPPRPARAPESAITERILRRVRMPAYRAVLGESLMTRISNPYRVARIIHHRMTPTPIPTRSPSGTSRDPTERPGHVPESGRSEEHTSELQSRPHLVCRLLLEKKKKK